MSPTVLLSLLAPLGKIGWDGALAIARKTWPILLAALGWAVDAATGGFVGMSTVGTIFFAYCTGRSIRAPSGPSPAPAPLPTPSVPAVRFPILKRVIARIFNR